MRQERMQELARSRTASRSLVLQEARYGRGARVWTLSRVAKPGRFSGPCDREEGSGDYSAQVVVRSVMRIRLRE